MTITKSKNQFDPDEFANKIKNATYNIDPYKYVLYPMPLFIKWWDKCKGCEFWRMNAIQNLIDRKRLTPFKKFQTYFKNKINSESFYYEFLMFHINPKTQKVKGNAMPLMVIQVRIADHNMTRIDLLKKRQNIFEKKHLNFIPITLKMKDILDSSENWPDILFRKFVKEYWSLISDKYIVDVKAVHHGGKLWRMIKPFSTLN